MDRDKELLKELSRLREEIRKADLDAAEGRRKLQQYQDILAKKPDVEAAQAALDALVPLKENAQGRLAKSQETAAALRDAREAKDKHLADSRVRIGELQARLAAAQAEAGKLADSGCPMPETATCKFLVSAVAAQAAIPELSCSLETMKAEDRARYEELTKAYEEALAAHEALGNPAEDLSELESKEHTYRTITVIAPQIAAAEAKLEEITASIQAAEARGAEAMRAADKVNAERYELTQAVTEYQAAQKSIEDNEPIAGHLADCQAANATADALEPQIERLRREVAELTGKVITAHQEAEDIRQRAPKAPGDAKGLRAVLESRRKSLTDFATQRGVIKAKLEAISEAEAQTAKLRRDIEDAAATLNDYTVLTQAFGLDGIQYMIIRGVVPEIMRQSNDILAAMTGGRMAVDIRTEREQKSTKTVVNSLEVWINTITGGNRPYQSHSGGEKVKIALAVTLGLADVKARRAGVQLGMLFIDEPPFLDADGTEAYADALVNMAARNPKMRILAISHDPTMKARFSQNIIVTGGEDGSSVTME